MTRTSSGDWGRTDNKYLHARFWVNPANWYWTKYNSRDLNERMHARIVAPAIAEMEKHTREDLIN
jgi:hypothetical protein